MHYFFVDAETDGLYGVFLSVAALVTDETGLECEQFYGEIDLTRYTVQSEWTRKNVLPYLKKTEYIYSDEDSLLEKFWQFWMRYRKDCICVADVGVPVEARLFAKCVGKNLAEREFLAPFPLHDLSPLLLAHEIDPLADRKALSGLSLEEHHAANDVRMIARIWHSYSSKQHLNREEIAE